jgi:hypothetical protein
MTPMLSEVVDITNVKSAVASGTTDQTGTGVDMSGWDGVLFVTTLGTPAVNNIMKAQQSNDDGSADDYDDLEGSAVAPGASDEQQFIDIYRPTKRYVRPYLTRGSATTVENIYAIRYRGRSVPHDNVESGRSAGVALVSPDEGTA